MTYKAATKTKYCVAPAKKEFIIVSFFYLKVITSKSMFNSKSKNIMTSWNKSENSKCNK